MILLMKSGIIYLLTAIFRITGIFLREGTRQAEMFTFPFAAAREPTKHAKRVLSGFARRHKASGNAR